MEALIIALIIGFISSLFKNKEQKQSPKKPTQQMPPFSSQPAPRTERKRLERPKTLEDFANEVFGQLNDKGKPAAEQIEQPLQVELPLSEPVKATERPKMQNTERTLTERPLVTKLKQQSNLQVVPQNNKELMQAIVMAEVLGPPKARRK